MSHTERPILFGSEMVRAILAGRKTQTRRIMKPQPEYDGKWFRWGGHAPNSKFGAYAANHIDRDSIGTFVGPSCPFGKPGDRLWVRETTEEDVSGSVSLSRYAADQAFVLYSGCEDAEFSGTVAHWDYPRRSRPSIHMPRRLSRIQLEITAVQVEHLQDITESDAMDEGVPLDADYPCELGVWRNGFPCPACSGQGVHPALGKDYGVTEVDCARCDDAKKRFSLLWESIYGAGSWDANPWVWAVEFRRIAP